MKRARVKDEHPAAPHDRVDRCRQPPRVETALFARCAGCDEIFAPCRGLVSQGVLPEELERSAIERRKYIAPAAAAPNGPSAFGRTVSLGWKGHSCGQGRGVDLLSAETHRFLRRHRLRLTESAEFEKRDVDPQPDRVSFLPVRTNRRSAPCLIEVALVKTGRLEIIAPLARQIAEHLECVVRRRGEGKTRRALAQEFGAPPGERSGHEPLRFVGHGLEIESESLRIQRGQFTKDSIPAGQISALTKRNESVPAAAQGAHQVGHRFRVVAPLDRTEGETKVLGKLVVVGLDVGGVAKVVPLAHPVLGVGVREADKKGRDDHGRGEEPEEKHVSTPSCDSIGKIHSPGSTTISPSFFAPPN